MQQLKIAEIDFDQWVSLAKDDPSAFEQQRVAAIEAYINSVPEANQERLRRLQWRIDQERRLARNPLNACIRITRMMWDNVLGQGGLRDRFENLGQLLNGEPAQVEQQGPKARPQAQVLAFARGAD